MTHTMEAQVRRDSSMTSYLVDLVDEDAVLQLPEFDGKKLKTVV